MALDDLDLEFEDEEEAKKKKSEAVHVDMDLEFHAQDEVKPKPHPNRPSPQGGAPRPAPAKPVAEVKRIDEARVQARRPQAEGTAPRIVGANALKSAPVSREEYDLESEEVVQLRERVRKVEFDAEVKVQVAEFKTEIIGELLGDMKLMEHQINQLLVRINAKHPDLKQEALMIKKILADFTTKKRK